MRRPCDPVFEHACVVSSHVARVPPQSRPLYVVSSSKPTASFVGRNVGHTVMPAGGGYSVRRLEHVLDAASESIIAGDLPSGPVPPAKLTARCVPSGETAGAPGRSRAGTPVGGSGGPAGIAKSCMSPFQPAPCKP